MEDQLLLDEVVRHVEREVLTIPPLPRHADRGPVFVTVWAVSVAAGKRLPRAVYVFPDSGDFFCGVAQSLAERGVAVLPTDDDAFRAEGAALDLFIWLVGAATPAPKRTLAAVTRLDPDQCVPAGARHVSVIALLPPSEPDPARLVKLVKRAFA